MSQGGSSVDVTRGKSLVLDIGSFTTGHRILLVKRFGTFLDFSLGKTRSDPLENGPHLPKGISMAYLEPGSWPPRHSCWPCPPFFWANKEYIYQKNMCIKSIAHEADRLQATEGELQQQLTPFYIITSSSNCKENVSKDYICIFTVPFENFIVPLAPYGIHTFSQEHYK